MSTQTIVKTYDEIIAHCEAQIADATDKGVDVYILALVTNDRSHIAEAAIFEGKIVAYNELITYLKGE